ncbi:hypothetical protein [Clavibacter michiganensis]|uniref:hypothetical protein n=1 Tax=Clavibacter michiganensis TaxID=28447 RepID=UPI00292ED731|nr:hypothetical protein [Clavibacter michiganensis]
MWMRRGRDGSEGERGSDGTHAIGVGAVVVILDGAAATGDPALDGEPVRSGERRVGNDLRLLLSL